MSYWDTFLAAFGLARRRFSPSLALPVSPEGFSRRDLPSDGMSSRPDDIYGWTLMQGYYAPPFDERIFRQLRTAEISTPDLAHALKLWQSFANTGHRLEITSDSDAQAVLAREILDSLSERLCPRAPGADGLVNAYLRQLGLYGCISSEDVLLPNLSGVAYIALVSPSQIRIGPDAIYQVVRIGQRLTLSPVTYAYYAWATLADSPYALPPLIAALPYIEIQKDMIDNIRHIMKKAGLLGMLDAEVAEPYQSPGETDSEYDSRLLALIQKVRAGLSSSFKEGILVHFSDVKVQSKSTAGGAADAPRTMQIVEEQLLTGAGIDPAMAGRSYSTTETYAGTVFRVLSQQAEAFQRIIKRRLEQTYRLELALRGISGADVSIEFDPLPSLKPAEDAQRRATEVDTALKLMTAGIRTPDEVAQMLGYDSATGTPAGIQQAGLSRNTEPPPFSASLSRSTEKTNDLLEKAVIDALRKCDSATDEAVSELLKKLKSRQASDFASPEEFQKWAMEQVRAVVGNADLILPSKQLDALYGAAWADGVRSAAIAKPALSMPDTRTLKILRQADGLFLSRHAWDDAYGAQARDWIGQRFLTDGEGIFGRMSKETISAFREKFGQLLKESSDMAVRRILETSVQRTRNWGIVENLSAGGNRYAKVAGPTDAKTCATCMALVGKKMLVGRLWEQYQEERTVLGAATINTDSVGRFFTRRNEQVRRAVQQSTEPTEGQDDLITVMPPFHPGCRHRLVAWVERDEQALGSQPPEVKTYEDGAKYIKKALADGTITPADKEYCRRYTNREEHLGLNAALLNGEKLTKVQQELAGGLSKSLEKLPKYDGITYRQIGFDSESDLKKALARYEQRNVVEMQFTSSSSEKAIAEGYSTNKPYTIMFNIQGKNGRVMNGLSASPEEMEVLFGTRSKFNTLSIDKSNPNHIIINMKED